MGIIVGFLAMGIAAATLLLAWPLGRLIGGFRRAALLLSALLFCIAAGIAWLHPVLQQRPESAIWPFATAGGAAFVVLVVVYSAAFSAIRRWLQRRFGQS